MAGKKINYKTQSVVFILIVLGFIAVANYLSNKLFARIDLTENKMYSISDASKNLLKGIDDIVTVKVYFSNNLPANLKKTETDVRDILSEFQAFAGSNLKIIWPDMSDDDTKKEAKDYGIPEIQMKVFEKDKAQVINGFLGVAVIYADKKENIPVISRMENFEYDLAQCIMKVFRTAVPKIGLLKTDTTPFFDEAMRMQMRGQLPPDPTEQKYKQIMDQLRQNYDVKTVALGGNKTIDPAIKTLIVPGGNESFWTDDKVFQIDQYFMKGGNLIVLADAVDIIMERGISATKMRPSILNLLEHYGVRVESRLVLDASCGQVQVPQDFGFMQIPVPVSYPYITNVIASGFSKNNPSVSGLAQMMFPWASPLTIKVPDMDSVNGDTTITVSAQILVRSSEKSWTSSYPYNLNPRQNWNQIISDKKDDLGTNNLVAYLKGNFTSYYNEKAIDTKHKDIVSSNTGRHLIVAGDADFLADQNAGPNIPWLLNVVDWLTLDENLISIRSRTLVNRTLTSDRLAKGNSYANMIRFLNILLMPLLVIGVGIIIFIRRREITIETKQKPKKENN